MSASIDVLDDILQRCRELGFALAGVCQAEPSGYGAELWRWLDAGKHGEMHYLASQAALRVDPAKLLPGARVIICVADRYHDGRRDQRGIAAHPEWHHGIKGSNPSAPRGRVARYARGDDYHVVIRKRLKQLAAELGQMFPQAQFRVCVDTAPILEREHAMRAGLGAIGKHTLLIEPGVGSYLLLGEIITTLDLSWSESQNADEAQKMVPVPILDPCGTCTRCIEACPTRAITPWSVDATRCISYLTIEHRGLIDEQFHEAMGDWIFGCDVCQEVCPHNQPTRRSRASPLHPAYKPREDRQPGLDLLAVLNWTEEDRRRAFTKSAMKRAKLAMMKRNALIAAGNAMRAQRHEGLMSRIGEVAADQREPELVRETAAAVLRRLSSSA